MDRKPNTLNYWAWGSGDMLGAGAMAVISGWLIYFLTTFCDLDVAQAALILALPRIVDAITCPIIGYVSDNLRHTWIGKKIGRRKIFLIIAIPLLPSFALIWQSGHDFAYYLTTFIFFEIVYAAVLIPWETLAAEMTKDYKEKAKFAGARMLVAQASAVLASYLPTLIIERLGGKDNADTFFIMGAIFGVIFSLMVLLVVIFTWERPYTEDELNHKPEAPKLKDILAIPAKMFGDLFSTLRIKAFRQHLSIYLGGYISQDIFNTVLPFFVTAIMLGATLLTSQLMTFMYIAQFVSVMLAINIVIKIGPTYAFRVACGLFTIGCLLFFAFYLIKPEGFSTAIKPIEGKIWMALFNGTSPIVLFWLFVPILLAGLGRGTLNFVPWSVYNYLPDIDEALTGQRREGIFAGVMTFVRKIAQACALAATGALLQFGGFNAKATTHGTDEIHTLLFIMVLGPIIVMGLGVLISLKFNLNATTHGVLVNEVERLRSGETLPSTPENGAIVEDLTGYKYADLWGRNTEGDAKTKAIINGIGISILVAFAYFIYSAVKQFMR